MVVFIHHLKLHQWKWLSNYIKNVVGGVFGMEIAHEVIIEGHAAAPDQAEAIIAEGLAKVEEVQKNYHQYWSNSLSLLLILIKINNKIKVSSRMF